MWRSGCWKLNAIYMIEMVLIKTLYWAESSPPSRPQKKKNRTNEKQTKGKEPNKIAKRPKTKSTRLNQPASPIDPLRPCFLDSDSESHTSPLSPETVQLLLALLLVQVAT